MSNTLFSPLKIGPMTISNRIMMSAMSAGPKVDENLEITDEIIAYYVERARTSPGMAGIGAAAVVPNPLRRGIRLFDEAILPSLTRLTKAVQQYDTRFGSQLFNQGGTGGGEMVLISPSGISSNVREARESGLPKRPQKNHALTLEEIPEIVAHYVKGAEMCARAGMDFVEIHAGHGYLISNFMTPLFNKRTDEYGGSTENRARFLLDILKAVKAALGDKLAVGVKFNGDDYIGDDGWTLAETRELAPMLEAAGADYLTLTAGLVGSPRLTIPPLYEPHACYADLAEAVKPLVNIPVATVGRIKTPALAEELIAGDKVDFVVLGRAFIADPEFAAKARAGNFKDIRPCLGECRGCADEHIQRGGLTTCVVNPRMSRELHVVDVEGAKKDNPKRILVIGAGLAGLEAARMTAFSGHQVTLCEEASKVGGQILLAAQMPGRGELGDILPWYETQLAKYGVDVRLNTRADRNLIETLAPDVVIVATGSLPEVPQNLVNLVMQVSETDCLMLDDMVRDNIDPGKKVVVIGGDQNGIIAADWLAEKGAEVWIAEAGGHFGQKLAGHDRWYLLNRLQGKPVHRYKNAGLEIGENEQIRLTNGHGAQSLEDIDTIVFASDRHSNRELLEVADKMGFETYAVGDANDATSEFASTILATIQHAYDVARKI
ncbi:MAG: NADH:flavin oxidoreductase [Alphaproteobacteria bacterium]|nr:MAG: NADH:flavin oxidoreductase [Alphaproteobacteria bacterium]